MPVKKLSYTKQHLSSTDEWLTNGHWAARHSWLRHENIKAQPKHQTLIDAGIPFKMYHGDIQTGKDADPADVQPVVDKLSDFLQVTATDLIIHCEGKGSRVLIDDSGDLHFIDNDYYEVLFADHTFEITSDGTCLVIRDEDEKVIVVCMNVNNLRELWDENMDRILEKEGF